MLILNFKHRCISKVQNRRKGSAFLAVVLILAVVSSLMSVGTAKITQVAISSTGSNKVTLQAQQYANSEAELIKATEYDDLASEDKTTISGSDYKKEITISDETDYSNTIKQKIATIKIYNGNDTLPRAELKVTRYSVEKTDELPIGTIIAWAGNAPWTDFISKGVWLECNGQSCADYPVLVKMISSSKVPDLRGRFLEGADVAHALVEPGLPNITGKIDSSYESGTRIEPLSYADDIHYSGAFSNITVDNNFNTSVSLGNEGYDYGLRSIEFDATRCSPIYGRSDTVQPKSMTVRYFIKAANKH